MDKWEELWKSYLEPQEQEDIEGEVIGTDVTVTKDVLTAFGGPTAYLRFEFNLNGNVHRCCWDTLTDVSYHSNEVDYGTKTEWKQHHYDNDEMEVLWNKYSYLLEDFDD